MKFSPRLGAVLKASLVAATLSSLVMSGCSTGVVASLPGTIAATGNATMTQAVITDAPGDQVVSLGLTIESIRMFDAAGKYADVLTTPTTIEASHLDAVQEPLRAPLNIPQDTYTSVLITVANPSVTYIDVTTHKPVQATATLTSATDTITPTTPLVVTATSGPISVDLIVGQSVSLSGAAAAVTPTFNVTQIPLAGHPTNGGNGLMNDIFGSFVSATTSSLTILTTNGTQVVVNVDSNTTFQGVASLSALTAGELIDIDVAQQAGGTLLAVRIHAGTPGVSNELVGPVTSVTGNPVTSFVQAVRQPVGTATSGLAPGSLYTISIGSSTTFSAGPQLGSLPTLPFTATFTSSTIVPGQNVAVAASAVSQSAGTATAAAVTLVPQTVDGTVATISTSGGFSAYTVTLPTGSALASLSGVTSVVVYSNSSTQFANANAVAVGSTVRFNGLLFNDAGTLRMLSGACNDPAGPPPPQHP